MPRTAGARKRDGDQQRQDGESTTANHTSGIDAARGQLYEMRRGLRDQAAYRPDVS
jgi:hypothetical protein